MNDLMSVGLHRAWKDALVTAVNPPKGRDRSRLLDIAGGTGDVALRARSLPGASGTRATVCDINADMLAVGRERAAARGPGDGRRFHRGERRGAAVCRPQLRCRHHRLRHPQRAAHRDARSRSVSRAQDRRAFLCLEFSAVDVPGLGGLYDFYSFNVIPGARPRSRRRRRRLSLSGGIDPPLSQPAGVRGDCCGRPALPASRIR